MRTERKKCPLSFTQEHIRQKHSWQKNELQTDLNSWSVFFCPSFFCQTRPPSFASIRVHSWLKGPSANVESVVFLRRILTTRQASFGVLASRAVMNEGMSATTGARPHRAMIITRQEVSKAFSPRRQESKTLKSKPFNAWSLGNKRRHRLSQIVG